MNTRHAKINEPRDVLETRRRLCTTNLVERLAVSSQRNLTARRKQCVCKICGGEFTRTTNQVTCSDKCREERSQQLYRERYSQTAPAIRARSATRYVKTREELLEQKRAKYANDAAYREKCGHRSKRTRKQQRDRDPQGYRIRWRNTYLKKTYGISHDEYEAMLASQGGTCAICDATVGVPGTNNQLSVDHDHDTGEIRGLLCVMCNRGIGSFRDDHQLLSKAAEYMLATKGTHNAT